MTKKAKSSQYNIRVVEKTIRVLGVLSDGKPRTLTEISEEVGINTSTTFRLIATLTNHKFLEYDDLTGMYRLGLACLELAQSYKTGNELLRVAKPLLEVLRDETKETVHLATLDGMEIVYIEKLESLHAIGLMSSSVGRRAPAHCTGVGKALLSQIDPETIREQIDGTSLRRFNEKTIVDLELLLSHLEEARIRGVAFDDGEHESEVRCVAAPIFDRTDQVVAAISVSGPKSRLDPIQENRGVIDITLKTAQEISAKLGHTP